MAKIERLKEEYDGEWLAIAYDVYGAEGLQEGDLVAHSPDKADVWPAIRGDHRKIYLTFAGPVIEEGTAIAISPILMHEEHQHEQH